MNGLAVASIDVKSSRNHGLSDSSESIQGNKHFYSVYFMPGTMPLPYSK